MLVTSNYLDRAKASHDEGFVARFCDIPGYLDMWTRVNGGLAGKRILDFGCGRGLSTSGIALTYRPSFIAGVDINSVHEGCLPKLREELGIDTLPDNLNFEKIQPGQVCSHDKFDVVYAWSVFEHVNRSIFNSIIDAIRAKIELGGLLFVQISPLYFSPEGCHLWEVGYTRWEHLRLQTNDIRSGVFGSTSLSIRERKNCGVCFVR